MSVQPPPTANRVRLAGRSRLFMVGAVFTAAAIGVEVWLVLVALDRGHPMAFAIAGLFPASALIAMVGMWRDLTRVSARRPPTESASALTCPRCGQTHIRRRDGLVNLLTVFGRRGYACQLCGCSFVDEASAVLATQGADDSRQHVRLPARLPVRCLAPDGISEAVVMDISMGGCRLETEAKLKDGAVIFLELGAAEHGNAVAIEATILRSAAPGSFAVQFRPPGDHQDRERFRWFVQRLLALPQAR